MKPADMLKILHTLLWVDHAYTQTAACSATVMVGLLMRTSLSASDQCQFVNGDLW